MGTSFPMILSTLFGNISASGPIKMIDCAFPKKYVEQFTGPKFGVEGIRDRLGVHDRPLVNAMIKPNTGWTPEEGADLFYQASRGGVDIIKDDELMPCNEDFCPQKDRVTLFMQKEKQVFEETGEHTLYATNITDRIDKVRDNAYRAIEYGANCLMINTYTSGFGTLQMLSEDPNIDVPILAHIDFAGVFCGATYTGLSAPLTIGKFVRLAGGDMQINGHPWGKFPFPMKSLSRCFRFFTQPWWNIKPMLYLVSGGTNQMMVDKAIKALGTDIVLAAGGAIHGHPAGSEAGAKSMRQAIDAAMEGVPVMKAKYEKAEVNVNKIAEALESHQVVLMKDVATLDKLYDLNKQYFKELSMYIAAGKQKLNETLTVELPALQQKAQQSGLPEDAQAANDLANMYPRGYWRSGCVPVSAMRCIPYSGKRHQKNTAPQLRRCTHLCSLLLVFL